MADEHSLRTFRLVTLGCKVNQYESQALREAWEALGWAEAPADAPPGVVVFNTCAVTARAVADLKNRVRIAHRAHPGSPLILTGCAAQALGAELAGLPGVAAMIPQGRKAGLLSGPLPDADAAADGGFPPFSISSFHRARAALKVQDGCSQRCAYCIVPLSRGPSRSRPPADILAEARRLLASGHRELVITGVNLAQYAHGGMDFWGLLAAVDAALAPEWAGRARLRMSSLDPGQLGGRALETLAGCRLVCPHLHLSLQSLAPEVLRRMGRGHTDPKAVAGFLAGLSRLWPMFALGADLLTGFPGETEAQAAETLAAVERLPLTYGHVFPYSPRPGTPAASLAGRISRAATKERAANLRHALKSKGHAFLGRLAALPRLEAVIERDLVDGQAHGMCEYYVDCRFVEPPHAGFMALSPARPVAARQGGLLVRHLPAATRPLPTSP